ncbi:MAG: hypothetical protein ACODAQ_03305 [Phycisphaeraceae bacterium]
MDPATHDKRQRLIEQVALTRRMLRRNAVWTGAALGLLAAGAWLGLCTGVDLLLALPVAGRLIAWVGFWLIVVGLGVAAVLWPALRPMRLVPVAFRIERALGDMHNRLVTVVDLERRHGRADAQHDPAHAEFVRRLIDQTEQHLADYRPERVANPAVARRLTVGAAAVVLTLAALTAVFHSVVGNALQRIAQPTAPIPPLAWAALDVEPDGARVLRGEPVTIRARVARGDVERVSLRITPQRGEPRRYPMRRGDDGTFTFTFDAVEASFDYRAEGGGTWTVPNRLTVLDRPIIERLDAEVWLPAYMDRAEPRPVDEATDQISAPVDSRVRVRAHVRGDVAEGRIDIYEARMEETDEARIQERVWFDDDLPADAERIGQWHWVRDPVYSGSRAHTFGWRREDYGFRTHLDPLQISEQEPMFVYARLDPADPPAQLIMIVKDEKRTYHLLWGDERTDAQKKQGYQHLGELPEPGVWKRLPLTPPRPMALREVTFRTPGGQVVLDRVGTLARVKRTVERTVLEKVDTRPMERDVEANEWTGEIPVEADRRFAVTFRNALGHESAAMEPMAILATTDQPPTLVVERPGRNVTLDSSDPMPLVVRAFDDYGVAEITVAVGAKADALGEPRTIGAFGEPRTSRVVMDALDPARLELEPGKSVHYRVTVRDQKGQEAHSEPYRLALAGETETRTAEADRSRRGALDGVLDRIGQLVEVQGDLASGAADLIGRLPEAIVPNLGEAELVDGESLSEEEVEALLAEWEGQLNDEQREAWAEAAQQLAEQRAELGELADQLEATADAAADSPQAMPMTPQAMRELAEQARRLAESMPEAGADEPTDPEVLQRLAELHSLTDAQENELAQLQAQLQQLSEAQRNLGTEPADAQQQLSNLMTQLRAREQVQQMQGLDAQLESEHAQLEALRQRLAQLQQQAAEAEAAQLDEISTEQQALDAEAIERTEELQAMLEEEADEPPLAPWSPPGREEEAMPVEQDTPEEDPQPDAPARTASQEASPSEEESEEEDWWDQPVDAPDAPRNQGEMSERYAERNRETEQAPPREVPGGPMSPREQLQEHQQRMDRALTENSNRVRATRGQMRDLTSQMREAMAQANQSDSGGQQAGMQQLQQLMRSPGAQRAQAMAMRAAMAAQGDGGEAEQATGPLRSGPVISLPLGAVEAGSTVDAATYRLPPALREPVMEGMREKGPAAYQPMIDAYYRGLSEEAGEDVE